MAFRLFVALACLVGTVHGARAETQTVTGGKEDFQYAVKMENWDKPEGIFRITVVTTRACRFNMKFKVTYKSGKKQECEYYGSLAASSNRRADYRMCSANSEDMTIDLDVTFVDKASTQPDKQTTPEPDQPQPQPPEPDQPQPPEPDQPTTPEPDQPQPPEP